MYTQKSHIEHNLKTKPEVMSEIPLGIYLDVICRSLHGSRGISQKHPTETGETVYLETLLINGYGERNLAVRQGEQTFSS